jgi:hypothetical protein
MTSLKHLTDTQWKFTQHLRLMSIHLTILDKMSIGLRNGMKKVSMPLSEPQREVIASDKRFRVLITGRRFGKTHSMYDGVITQR